MGSLVAAGPEAHVRGLPTSYKKTSLDFLVSELQLYNNIRILTPVAGDELEKQLNPPLERIGQ